jgi:leucyl-tRNA synthetase
LADAKAEVYLKGFYKGIMKIGTHQGKTVDQAKKLIKNELIELG